MNQILIISNNNKKIYASGHDVIGEERGQVKEVDDQGRNNGQKVQRGRDRRGVLGPLVGEINKICGNRNGLRERHQLDAARRESGALPPKQRAMPHHFRVELESLIEPLVLVLPTRDFI